MKKLFLKFIAGGVGLVAIAAGVLFLVQYARYQTSPEYRAWRELKALERRYAEDTYGGSTPEETLQLFIGALKKGDVELASRYFVVDEQEKQRENLMRTKEKDLVGAMLTDLQKLGGKYPLINGDDKRFIFEAFNEQGELILQADITRGPNGKWKIVDL